MDDLVSACRNLEVAGRRGGRVWLLNTFVPLLHCPPLTRPEGGCGCSVLDAPLLHGGRTLSGGHGRRAGGNACLAAVPRAELKHRVHRVNRRRGKRKELQQEQQPDDTVTQLDFASS